MKFLKFSSSFLSISLLILGKAISQDVNTKGVSNTLEVTVPCETEVHVLKMSDFRINSEKKAIIVGDKVIASSRVVLSNGYKGEIQARKEIHLLPGFSSAAGSDLHLYIQDFSCSNYTGYLKGKSNITLMPVINIFPNPNNGHFVLENNFQAIKLSKIDFTIMTLEGKLIKKGTLNSSTIQEFDLKSISKGFYLIKLENLGESFLEYRRIVIQ